MPRKGPIFQDHHVIEQQTLGRSQLLEALSDTGYFDIDAQENRIFLPSDPELAKPLVVTPHSGGPIRDYQVGTQFRLLQIERSSDGRAAMAGDPDALQRVAARVDQLRDTMTVGLVNGDLHTNSPLGLTSNDIRPGVQSFFGNSTVYANTHSQQMNQLGTLSGRERGWSVILQSENRVISTLDYASQSGNNLIRGGSADAGRQALSQALSDSYGAGRLTLSETSIQEVHNVLGSEAAEPLRVPRGQRGFASHELLMGEIPRNTLIRSGGLLATGADLVTSTQRAAELAGQGNDAAAQSEINHALARNAGGWVGGASAASVVGTSGFAPAALVVGDAILMSKAFDKAVDLVENRKIFNQVDRDNVAWEFTGRNWTREGSIDASQDGRSNPEQGRLGASYEKARELGAKASAVAVDYALGDVPTPVSPFIIPAQSRDRIGLDNADWQRNPDTEQWTRMVKTSVTGINDQGVYEPQIASPERAMELNQEAIQRIGQNLQGGREAVASAYLLNYTALRSADFVESPPASVQMARPMTNRLMGSDREVYQRDLEGAWTNSKGEVAQGNMALELELTRIARQPSLDQFEQRIADLEARPQPTQEQLQQNELLHRYRVAKTELNPEYQQAIEQAVQRTRQENGITGAGSLQLLPNGDRQIAADSPIAHYQRGADGVERLVATTTTQDIQAALAQVRGIPQSEKERIPTLDAVAAVAPPGMKRGIRDAESQVEVPAPERTALLADNASHPDLIRSSTTPRSISHQWGDPLMTQRWKCGGGL